MEIPVSIEDIRRCLPHRYPFLMVDRVTEIDRGNGLARGYKNITINEPVFTGHFPGQAIFPGVLILEALAQLGAFYLLSEPDRDQNMALFAGVDKARFRRPVVPGDRLDMEVRLLRDRGRYARMRGIATVNGHTAAAGEFMSAQTNQ